MGDDTWRFAESLADAKTAKHNGNSTSIRVRVIKVIELFRVVVSEYHGYSS
jgi:hypothetical protein